MVGQGQAVGKCLGCYLFFVIIIFEGVFFILNFNLINSENC